MRDPSPAAMAVSSDGRAPARDRAIRLAAGLLGAAILLAIVDAGAIALMVPTPLAGAGLRASHYFFDAAETLGVGALAAAVAGAFVAFVRVPRWVSFLAAVGVTAALVELAVGENVTRVASLTLNGRFETAISIGYRIVLALAIPGAFVFAAFGSCAPRSPSSPSRRWRQPAFRSRTSTGESTV